MESAQSMMDVPAIAPPPGVTSNFENPVSHDSVNIVFHTICISLATVFLVMRFYTRYFILHWLAWDDYLCAIAYVSSVAWSGLYLEAQRLGFGRHLWDLRAIDIVGEGHLLEILLVIELLSIPTVTMLKVSFLLFFERVFFPNKALKHLTRWGMTIIVLFNTGLLLQAIWSCRPVQKAYRPEIPGTCDRGYITPYFSGVFNVISDFYILALPLPFLWRLNMNIKRKIRVMAVFSIGLFSCCTSVVRLAYIAIYVNDRDVTWHFWILMVWSVLEVDVGIICACSLALPAFIDRFRPKISTLLHTPKIFSYFSNNISRGGSNLVQQQFHDDSSNALNLFPKEGSSQSSDLHHHYQQDQLSYGQQSQSKTAQHTKSYVDFDISSRATAFGNTTARGDAENLAFETNVEGGGGATRQEDLESCKGQIVKRVDLFQTSLKPELERGDYCTKD